MSPKILFFVLVFIAPIMGENCVCVPFWKCNDEDFSSEDEFDPATFRTGCKGYFDVCCKIKCGQRKTENLLHYEMIRNRILGQDNEANFAEFPWMLGILLEKNYHCGASLIHPKVALTAAHCVQKSANYKIRAGEWDWSNRKEPLKHQDRSIKKIIIHPLFNPNSLINDIALIFLDRPFQLTENVGIVCLPPQNSSPLPEECVVTGWGKTSHSSPKKHQAILNKATFPLVGHSRCERALKRAQLGPLFKLHQTFMCAGGGKKDTCKGDGGSPLMCAIEGEEDRFEQFGIVAWGLRCGLSGAPGVYVSVAKFIDWIDQEVSREKLDIQMYKY